MLVLRLEPLAFLKLAGCYFVGALKGLFLLPILIPWLLVAILGTNLLAIPVWLNHGYFALRLLVDCSRLLVSSCATMRGKPWGAFGGLLLTLPTSRASSSTFNPTPLLRVAPCQPPV